MLKSTSISSFSQGSPIVLPHRVPIAAPVLAGACPPRVPEGGPALASGIRRPFWEVLLQFRVDRCSNSRYNNNYSRN